jgi:alcohol dehydrogenase (cytochrome c)
MHMQHISLRGSLLAGALTFAALGGACAAEVTYERLANPDKEPQNWLMVHRSYDAQRFSPLDQINKQSVKNLKFLFAVAIGGANGNESIEATPLVEDGFMYIVDHWGVVYKIDVRSGKPGASSGRWTPARKRATAIAA